MRYKRAEFSLFVVSDPVLFFHPSAAARYCAPGEVVDRYRIVAAWTSYFLALLASPGVLVYWFHFIMSFS
jgi:hypothetical protein